MNFRIAGLSPEPFRPLFGLEDAALAALGARRLIVDAKPGFPDRIELRDAEPGETVILVNHEHQPANNPFRSRHAVFVIEGAAVAYDRVNQIPDVMLIRPMSLRAFDADDMMIDADLASGGDLKPLIDRLLANPDAAYIHAHYARRGCYAARIQRA
ncbi:MAG TPA: DUF1203 domain-containing protein [Caulobacteraceae bacterium]|nr:DUF1203 domain-containing protein [Caulobacteraceae bacterium]